MNNDKAKKVAKNPASRTTGTESCYVFGQRVNTTHKLKRVKTTRKMVLPSGKEHTSQNWKVWERVPYTCVGAIFLGTRTLKNGIREFDSECGWSFDPKEHFKAALICITGKLNPVFVPLDCLSV